MNQEKIPNHLGIIMDGNGRWATAQGKGRSAGHLAGSKNLKKLALYAFKRGIKVLSIFAFSTENFKRSKEEVDFLMNLFVKTFNQEFKIFNEKNIKVVFSKQPAGLPEAVEKSIIKIQNDTKDNTAGIFNICINYGGQDEIVETAKKLSTLVQNNKIKVEDINKELFAANLCQNLPPIDLLIRTSGEYRVSNFMLWSLAYAEFYFPDVHFPDFNEVELDKAITAYNSRDRRFGGINYERKNN